MPPMTVAPQSMPVIASATTQTTTPGAATDFAEGTESGVDFAAVLKTRFTQPAKDAPETENIAALLPPQAREATEDASETDGLPAAPDLAALLPGLSGHVPHMTATVTGNPVTHPAAETTDGQLVPASSALVAPPAVAAPAVAAPAVAAPAVAAPAVAATLSAANNINLAAHETFIEGAPAGEEADSSDTPSTRLVAGFPEHSRGREISAAANPRVAEPQVFAAAVERARPTATGPQTPALTAENVKPVGAEPQMPVAAQANHTAQATAPMLPGQAALAGNASQAVRIETPVGTRGWDAEVGQKIVLLVSRQESRAELTLTPPQFGKLEITISINGDQTSATFVSASPAAREALEQALPRLREMMAEAGISLGQASVNAESAQRGQDESPTGNRGSGRGTDAASAAIVSTQWVQRSSGLIDTFA